MEDCIWRKMAISELMEFVKRNSGDRFGGALMHYTGVKAMLECLPAADVKPVASGKWIDYKDEHQCSECKNVVICNPYTWEDIRYPICPYCGAEMEE